MPHTTSACSLTKKAGVSAAKVNTGTDFIFLFSQISILSQIYTSLASSEIIDSVEVIDSNLPSENNKTAIEIFSEAIKNNAKVSDVINQIHNEALQNLPNVRKRFFIR